MIISEQNYHTPVLLEETINALKIRPDGIYIDATVGGGGHSFEIAKQLRTGKLLAFDVDNAAIEFSKKKLNGLPVSFFNSNYSQVQNVLKERYFEKVDGILMDLGVSSFQLNSKERGFSFKQDGPLDMRMGENELTALDVVNKSSKQDLIRILKDYGEERFANSIVSKIIKLREQKTITSTLELAEIIKSAIPAKFKRLKNPCKKSFQAIRIAVNNELENLKTGLKAAFNLLKPTGRLAVISFHSLEDRIVKNFFVNLSRGCICPPKTPICICNNKPKTRILTKKPIIPSFQEVLLNSRSKSAKLRILEKL